jgi:hypothetical protein
MTFDGRADLVDIQASFDQAFRDLGSMVPAPSSSETPSEYRTRCLYDLAAFSPEWHKLRPHELRDPQLVRIVEPQIREDAKKAATDNDFWRRRQAHRAQRNGKKPELHERTVKDESGRDVKEYFGDPLVWMQKYMIPPRFVAEIGGGLLSRTSRTIRGR